MIWQFLIADSDSMRKTMYIANWKCLEPPSLAHTRQTQFPNKLNKSVPMHIKQKLECSILKLQSNLIFIAASCEREREREIESVCVCVCVCACVCVCKWVCS